MAISMCGFQIYHTYEKQMYKHARIKYIKTHPTEQLEGLISLKLTSFDCLPVGYEWEDKGTEFTFNGMLYDIISISKCESGFIINALADASEITLDQKHLQLAQQQKEQSSKSQQIFKWVFAPFINTQKDNLFIGYFYSTPIFTNTRQDIVSMSLDNLLMPPEMN